MLGHVKLGEADEVSDCEPDRYRGSNFSSFNNVRCISILG